MIHLCTSHRTEVLVDAFLQNMADERRRHGPYQPVVVVVPNRNVESYLRLNIAQRCGIAANIETTFLGRFLADLVEQAVPGARVVDAMHCEGQLLALFHDDSFLASPELSEVRAYFATTATDRDALDRRRCQLANEIARLFDEYQNSRPAMLASWARPNRRDRQDGGGHERWQRALWSAVFGPEGRLARNASPSCRHASWEILWDEAMRRSPRPFAGRSLHVFGLSYIAQSFHRRLADLTRESQVFLYTQSPCREDPAELPRQPEPGSADPYRLDQEANLALRLWARPGRENLRLLLCEEGTTLDQRFAEDVAAKETLLGRLQDDIVHRRARPAAGSRADGTLRVLPCPSLRRELEVISAEIWSLVRSQPSLRLCDVAVIVPETAKDLYLTDIPAVFRESCDLPFNLSDLAAAGHGVASAIEMLVHLPFSTFTRKDLLPLLCHPCVMARFPEATAESWRALVNSLGIVRGVDRGDLAASYVDRDLLTWDQGLRRLALGAFADAGDDPRPFAIDGQHYLPGPPVGVDDATALGFGLLVRSLLADARFAAGQGKTPERPLHAWLDFVLAMVQSYVLVPEDDSAGKKVITDFLAGLDDLYDTGLGDQPISYRVAAELAERVLATLSSTRGQYRTEGVTVASFVPMRAIPFEAIFVLGLGNALFPRRGGRPELDLRGSERLAGDVDRRQQDLYMFLETLLSARRQITFSYVSRDEITGDELPCSEVLHELRTMLADGYLESEELARLFCDDRAERPPLRRFDDKPHRREVLPPAEAEYRAKVVGRSVVPAGLGLPPALEHARHLPPTYARKIEQMLGLPSLAPDAAVDVPSPLRLPLSALRRFLQDPLEGSARFRLRMFEEPDLLPDLEDEPFDMDGLLQSSLLRASITKAILAAQAVPSLDDLLGAYDRQALHAELGGVGPTGLFGRAAERSGKEVLRAWLHDLPRALGSEKADCRTFVLARPDTVDQRLDDTVASREVAPSRRRQAAPRVTVTLPLGEGQPDRTVEIIIDGQTGLWARSRGMGEVALAFTCSKRIKKGLRRREELRAFLEYAAFVASGTASTDGTYRSAVFSIGETGGDLRLLRFAALGREQAERYLAGLCRELLAGAGKGSAAFGLHPYLLPDEAVFASHCNRSSVVDEVAACYGEDGARTRFGSLLGPASVVAERYAPPPFDEATRMMSDRFGLFFDSVVEEEP